MNRRALFGFLGVSPIAAAGAALATQRHQTDGPVEGKDGALGGVLSIHSPSKTQVHVTVGRDGSLWLKPHGNGRWQRVVTERDPATSNA